MNSLRLSLAAIVSCCAVSSVWAANAASFRVTVPQVIASEALNGRPLTGRLIVFAARTAEPEPRRSLTIWRSPAIFGVDVEGARAGATDAAPIVVDAAAAAFPVEDLSQLPAGEYFVQALLIRYTQVQRADGHTIWVTLPGSSPSLPAHLRPGNLYSKVSRQQLDPVRGFAVDLTLNEVIPPESAPPETEWLRTALVKSEILSRFWGAPIFFGARVLLPRGFDASAGVRYPALYVFGHGTPFFFDTDPASHEPELASARAANLQTGYEFYQAWKSDRFPRVVALCPIIASPYDTESYALDSANNGPWGQAITQELIPYLEKTFRLIPKPYARIVEGASTGGWEALALQLHYPDYFGGAWVFNPDPIDFSRYQLSDIYRDENMYEIAVTPWVRTERAFMRNKDGQPLWTTRQVARFEAVLGSKGRSNYQLGIWQATHGPAGADGYPVPLFDSKSGRIDRAVAHFMRDNGYDLTDYTRRNWPTLGPQLAGKLHFFSGEQDDFFLNLGVYNVQDMLATMQNPRADATFAYGRPKKGHNWHLTDFAQMVRDMADHIRKAVPAGENVEQWNY